MTCDPSSCLILTSLATWSPIFPGFSDGLGLDDVQLLVDDDSDVDLAVVGRVARLAGFRAVYPDARTRDDLRPGDMAHGAVNAAQNCRFQPDSADEPRSRLAANFEILDQALRVPDDLQTFKAFERFENRCTMAREFREF